MNWCTVLPATSGGIRPAMCLHYIHCRSESFGARTAVVHQFSLLHHLAAQSGKCNEGEGKLSQLNQLNQLLLLTEKGEKLLLTRLVTTHFCEKLTKASPHGSNCMGGCFLNNKRSPNS